MQQQLQINWTMVQELRMDGELNNYSKYLVCVLCVCVWVGVCVFSLSSRTCSISLGALCKCVHHNRCKSWVFFFLSSAPLACSPFHSWAAGACCCLCICVLEGQLQETETENRMHVETNVVMAHTWCRFSDTVPCSGCICELWQYILQHSLEGSGCIIISKTLVQVKSFLILLAALLTIKWPAGMVCKGFKSTYLVFI